MCLAFLVVEIKVLLAAEDGLGDEGEALAASVFLEWSSLQGDNIWLAILGERSVKLFIQVLNVGNGGNRILEAK